ncbi:MAG: 23S rRNA (adenine(2503)-C(2))-methyltransferase RlmN, partial [Atopobium sp.]|nr:23S rRNA (adenine(2503)-C(2))-methyltransferase RlmN [Atopobium sp.]
MQSNNTLDGTNTTVDGADTSAPDSRPQKAAAKSDLRSLSSEQILDLVASLGQPKFRVKQIEEWIWSKGATSFDQMSNLPKTLREELSTQ